MNDNYEMAAIVSDALALPKSGEKALDSLRVADRLAAAGYSKPRRIQIVFDGPPSNESGRFIDVEDETGQSITAGTWTERADGYWVLAIERPDAVPVSIDAIAHLCNHGYALCAPCDHVPYSWKVQP